MAEHRNLTGDSLHEPKGVEVATAGTTYVANGSGSGTWKIPQIQGQSVATVGQVPMANGSGGTTWVDNKVTSAVVLRAQDTTSQLPSAVNTPLQVKFGIPQSNSFFSLAADGTLTVLHTGNYLVESVLRASRQTSAANVYLAIRYLINGVQASSTQVVTMSDATFTLPIAYTLMLTLTAGDTITAEIATDGAGINSGGLIPFTVSTALQGAPAGSWDAVSPSATLTIYELSLGN
jgi:hypothetical protein